VAAGVRGSERKRGLADSARAEHGDVAVLSQQMVEGGKIRLAADQRRWRAGWPKGLRATGLVDAG
jgi:hypothetical protein